jgi:hypothetical protein
MKAFHNVNLKLMLTLEQDVINRTTSVDTEITRIPNILENWHRRIYVKQPYRQDYTGMFISTAGILRRFCKIFSNEITAENNK